MLGEYENKGQGSSYASVVFCGNHLFYCIKILGSEPVLIRIYDEDRIIQPFSQGLNQGDTLYCKQDKLVFTFHKCVGEKSWSVSVYITC